MTSMDTLKAASELEAAGVTREHAAAIARAINDHGRAELATKQDIAQLRADLESLIWRQTAVIAGTFVGIAGLFKLFA